MTYMQEIQVEVGGLNLTASDGSGTDWIAQTLDGWWGSPGSSIQLTQKLHAAGGWSSPRDLTPRTLTMTGFVEAASSVELQTALDRLNSVAALDGATFQVTEDGQTRYCTAYRQGDIPTARGYGSTSEHRPLAAWSLQLVASDPRKFATPVSESTGLPSSTGGFTVPMTVPLVISSTTVAGTVGLTNPGNASGPLTVRVDGPGTGPLVRDQTTGRTVALDASLVLATGEFLIIDMENQVVLANGVTSRNGYLTRREWFGFNPGSDVFEVDSGAYDAATLFTFTGTPAWL